MKTKTEEHPSVLKATLKVIRAVFLPVNPGYEYTFPERKILHEKMPPHVQSVNEYLDVEKVKLGEEHIEHFIRGVEIDNYPATNVIEKQKQQWKSIKNERKIAASFNNEAETEAGQNTPDQKIINYAKAGYWAHTIFGAGKAAMNPYVSHEEGLGIGATHDYLDYCQDCKK